MGIGYASKVDHDEKVKGNAPENQLIHKVSLCLRIQMKMKMKV